MSDLPKFDVSRIVKTRERLLDTVFYGLYGTELVGDELTKAAHLLRKEIGRQVEFSAVFESLRVLAGKTLDQRMCREFAWRLAGNMDKLKEGKPVLPWTVQEGDEWVLLQVIRGTRTRNHKNDSGLYYDFRVIAGSSAPLQISKFWSHSQCGRVGRAVGFSAPSGKYPYSAGEQLVGLRFQGHVEAAKSHGEPWFHEIGAPVSCKDWNRQLLRLRLHHTPCPNSWEHPCHTCVIGYQECDAGTHPLNYEKKFCEGCGEETFFDPDLNNDRCVTCDQKYRLRRRT